MIKTEKLGLTLEDLSSAKGTFLDGQKVTAKTELLPGQTIELGTGGPKVVFDVEPRPAHLVARTRMIKQPVDRETSLTDADGKRTTKGGENVSRTINVRRPVARSF